MEGRVNLGARNTLQTKRELLLVLILAVAQNSVVAWSRYLEDLRCFQFVPSNMVKHFTCQQSLYLVSRSLMEKFQER